MRQVFHNLLRNAIEAAEGDAVRADVKIATQTIQHSNQTMVEITIIDNGPGFADSIVHQVFEPYVTSKVKGTGLGLAIVKKIVEEHGGQIRAHNRKPVGAQISILLPIPGGGAMLNAREEQWRERA